MSLQLRLIISIGLALLATLAFGSALTFLHAAHQVKAEIWAAVTVGEHIVKNAIGDTKQDTRRQRLERIVAEFDGNRHIQAVLVDDRGRVLSASIPVPPDSRVPGWFKRYVDGLPQPVTIPSDTEDHNAIVLAAYPGNELAEAWSDTGLSLAVLVTFSTLVLGLVYWILAWGLRPLKTLNVAFARIGKGDYTAHVEESGPTEFAYLAQEFNRMVSRLCLMKLQNDRLNEQLANVQEEERADIARELHDEIGPFLFAVSLDVAAMHQISKEDATTQLAPRFEAMREAIAHMQKHLKSILGRLRPTVLLDFGLAHAVDNLVVFWKARHPDVAFNIKIPEESFGEILDDCIYRILRESVSNALRHGQPTSIDIIVRTEAKSMIAVEVIDDGDGMKLPGPFVGFGIIGMQERAASLSGTLIVENRDGRGVIVRAKFPLQSASDVLANELTEEPPA
jgi:two-component system, NarL family, sensor histidine kinase UhpB